MPIQRKEQFDMAFYCELDGIQVGAAVQILLMLLRLGLGEPKRVDTSPWAIVIVH